MLYVTAYVLIAVCVVWLDWLVCICLFTPVDCLLFVSCLFDCVFVLRLLYWFGNSVGWVGYYCLVCFCLCLL